MLSLIDFSMDKIEHKTKVALVGGSFDPPTVHHLNVVTILQRSLQNS